MTLDDGREFSSSFVINIFGVTLLTKDQKHISLCEQLSLEGFCPKLSER